MTWATSGGDGTYLVRRTEYIRVVLCSVLSTVVDRVLCYYVMYVSVSCVLLTNEDLLTTQLIETLEWLSDYVYLEMYGYVCTTATLFLYRNQGRSIGQGDADGPTESKCNN